MSWISKAESLLNKIDQSAAIVLHQKPDDASAQQSTIINIPSSLPRVMSSKNIMILNKTPKKATKSDAEWESKSDSRRSSVSSRHETVIDKEDSKSMISQNHNIKKSSSNVSLNSFSVEKELAATKILLSELRSENIELKTELDSMMENNNSNSQVNELQKLIATITEEKEKLIKLNQSLDNSNTKYVKTISEMETSIMKLQQNENDLKHKLEFAKNETTNATNELNSYRNRAQNQLQMKEKMIEQLRSGELKNNDSDNVPQAFQIEMENLKAERDLLQSEVNSLTHRFDESRSFIERMEHKHRMMQAEAEDKIVSLDEAISHLTIKNSQYEEEMKHQHQEIATVRDEMLKQKTFMTTKLHEKENELKRLKNSYRESQMQVEIENRMQSLTDSLISKQNSLENITAERNALRLQLEKLSHQHDEVLVQVRHQRQQIIISNETDDAKSHQVPNFFRENPFDSRISRRVKKAYSNLDQMGVRLGLFIRRYPLARIGSIFYVILFHLFVVFVLFQKTPSN